jgi:hypothetical protein
MPFFNFTAGPGQRVVLPEFWIYWLVTIPLTATVMILLPVFFTRTKDHIIAEKRRRTVKEYIFGPLSKVKHWFNHSNVSDGEKMR